MKKRKKQKKLKEKFLEKPPKEVSGQKSKDSGTTQLEKQIEKLCKGLYYISETDAEITPFTGIQAEATTKEEILSQTKSLPDTPVEERDFDEFFRRLTEIQDWFGDEERQTVRKFYRY
ncbi:MAG: nuclease A inhibitor family protein [Acidobacteria bacterium]|nr:nuclease A inhibitor family protein [Acidobacteriota bacterium]